MPNTCISAPSCSPPSPPWTVCVNILSTAKQQTPPGCQEAAVHCTFFCSLRFARDPPEALRGRGSEHVRDRLSGTTSGSVAAQQSCLEPGAGPGEPARFRITNRSIKSAVEKEKKGLWLRACSIELYFPTLGHGEPEADPDEPSLFQPVSAPVSF